MIEWANRFLMANASRAASKKGPMSYERAYNLASKVHQVTISSLKSLQQSAVTEWWPLPVKLQGADQARGLGIAEVQARDKMDNSVPSCHPEKVSASYSF